MKPTTLPADVQVSEEVASLTEALRANMQRLQELTVFEARAGLSAESGENLMRLAKDQLHYNEAAKQVAILNALSAHIALLDHQGRIIQVNDAWRKFSLGNLLQGPGQGIGVNYLWICDSASGDDSGEARQVATGIRSVLNDGLKHFSVEYPCHSSTEQHWFCLTVTPMIYGRQTGAVVMHTNITQQKIASQELLESERRFSDMLANVQLASVMLDLDAKITYCNEYLLQMTGWKQEEVIGLDWFETFMPKERDNIKAVFDELLKDEPDAKHRENEIVTRSGENRLFRWNNSVLRSGAGEVIGTASIGEDITERQQAFKRIAQLNRIHIVLSSINSLILRSSDRDELFREACTIAVEAGGFHMALIGMIDTAAMKFVPVASAGLDHGLFAAIEQELASRGDPKTGATMGVQAVKEKRAIVSNDPQNDPMVLLGQRYVDSGIRSLAVLPLIVADQGVGVLALYADESDFFHEDELALLNTLAGNISFAMDHIKKQERLDYLAYYDDVTGLANRRLFIERVALYMRSAESAGHQLAVGLIDLERFKNINDSLGHAAGDALLKQIAQWLAQNLGGDNLVAHLGADHFAMVIPVVVKGGNVERLLNKQFEALINHPFQLNDGVFKIAFKGGIAVFPEDGLEAGILFKNAEAALKKAKARGDRYLFYQPGMTEKVAGRLTMENQLRQALENDEFVLHYQPKISLESGKLTGAEALIRWNDPRTGLVPPGQFISILEETGLIYEVGRWAFRDALNTHLRWRNKGLPATRIAVNVSPLQLRHRDFVSRIRTALSFDPNAAECLELEITESLIMEDVKHSIASLKAIRDMGVKIAIDDFGTGFSSLSYLSKLPVDTLKIDRSFITEMTISPEGLSLVSTIINLGQSFKLNIVAEGVETEEQKLLLKSLKCEEMQGFLFSKAVPSDEFEKRFLKPESTDCKG